MGCGAWLGPSMQQNLHNGELGQYTSKVECLAGLMYEAIEKCGGNSNNKGNSSSIKDQV